MNTSSPVYMTKGEYIRHICHIAQQQQNDYICYESQNGFFATTAPVPPHGSFAVCYGFPIVDEDGAILVDHEYLNRNILHYE